MTSATKTAALIVGIILAIVCLAAIVVLVASHGGLRPALAALLGGGLLAAGVAAARAARPLPDVSGVDDAGDDATDDAIAEAALGMEEARHAADDVRSGSGAGDDDSRWLRDALNVAEWEPPVDPRASTEDD